MSKYNKTILITGGAGFIGSTFLKHMFNKYQNYNFIVLDALTYAGNLDNISEDIKNSRRFEFWHGDVCDSAIVNKLVQRSDIIVHFAAESHVTRSIYDNSRFFMTDVIGTQTISNAVVDNKNIERFIHISTSEVYGNLVRRPMKEDHPLEPRSPYAAAKAGADRLVQSYILTYKIPAIILRPFNNYGPFQHLEKVIPRFITSALMDEPFFIHGTGNGSRDWIFVEDTCKAIDDAMHENFDKVKFQTINLSSGKETSVIDIAKMILSILGKSENLIKYVNDRPGQVMRHLGSREKAEKLLGWKVSIAFKEGLKQTIEWYKNNEKWWEKQVDMRSVPIKTENNTIELH